VSLITSAEQLGQMAIYQVFPDFLQADRHTATSTFCVKNLSLLSRDAKLMA